MKRRSFFLGAGFSKALNPAYPTLAELSKAVVSGFRARYTVGAVREHFDQLPQGFEKNIELLLTYLYSDWPWKSSVENDLDNALYKAFVYEIAAALENISMVAIPEPSRQFIHYIRTSDQNSIISLNYDNLIEQYRYPENYGRCSINFGWDFNRISMIVEEPFWPNRKTSALSPWVVDKVKGSPDHPRVEMFVAREWVRQVSLDDFRSAVIAVDKAFKDKPPYGVDGVQFAYESLHRLEDFYPVARSASKLLGSDADPRQFEGSTGKVIHLHGSIDWRGDTLGPSIRLTDSTGQARLEKLPAIVPPVMDKSRHYAAGRVRDQWIKAHSEIQKSQEVIVIGFSFPPTDISCHYLFKSAVTPGTRVVVVNRDSSASLVERYRSVFEGIKDIELDFSFLGGDDSLNRYVHSEVL